MARCRRRFSKTSSSMMGAAAVSLATIRKRLYQAMRDQNHLLLSIIHPVLTESSESNNNEEEEEVLTLSLLHSLRRESTELVLSAADSPYSAGATEAQQQEKIQRLLQTTREACEYFESLLECRQQQGQDNCDDNDDGLHAIGSDVQAIHQQLVGLQSLVTSFHGVLYCCGNESSSTAFDGEQQFQQLWSEFNKRFSMLHDTVENVDKLLVNQNASSGGIENRTTGQIGTHCTGASGERRLFKQLSVTLWIVVDWLNQLIYYIKVFHYRSTVKKLV
jgi:hypothetical protein